MLNLVIAFLVRLLLVALFLPFSALDKLIEFDGAVAQARESLPSKSIATLAIVAGLTIEVVMSLAILTGVADRMGAFILAGYCGVTALLWKPFWKPGDFWNKGASVARGLFWDFWKNLALAGGFLLITFGTGAASVDGFLEHPWASSQPYASACNAMSGVLRLARIGLNTADPEALAAFFVDALGFERLPSSTTVRLGDVPVDLHHVAPSLAANAPGWSPLFQHFAIVVSDMPAAMERLATSTRWTPISTDGPQQLPATNGGVTAFKFRDAEGHPLELLAFPDAPKTASPFVRIDHSAISVVDVTRSLAFYADLGLQVASRSLNVGPAQQRLDAIDDAEVDVIGLASDASDTPHIELLGYRGEPDRRAIAVAAIDAIAATRLVLTVADRIALEVIEVRLADAVVRRSCESLLLRDPDGHLLELVVEG